MKWLALPVAYGAFACCAALARPAGGFRKVLGETGTAVFFAAFGLPPPAWGYG